MGTSLAIAEIQKKNGATAVDITPQDTAISLDDRLRDAFSFTSAATEAEYASIMAKVNDAEYVSSPGALFELQVRLGDYKQQVEVISALTRKAVATAETVLRA